MVRKQILIEDEQERTLERLSSELDMSQSEVVRQAIDDFAERIAREDERQAAWRRLMHMFENASDLGLVDDNGNRTWTREDLYRDRLG
jgi:predicted transcriptional regulator